MFRSLQSKLVLIFLLLILALTAVEGTFLANSVMRFYMSEFSSQMATAFNENDDFVQALFQSAKEENAASNLYSVVGAYSSVLGTVQGQRDFYILDGYTGRVISSMESVSEIDITPNIAAALKGEPGYELSNISPVFDCAYPIFTQENRYILYIVDNKTSLNRLTGQLMSIIIQSMLFGLIISILLSLLLSKTMTNPIEHLTRTAKKVANGDFGDQVDVYSRDEIGILTQTFNHMSGVLKNTLEDMGNERDKLSTLFLYMTDGVAAYDRKGHVLHVNPAAISMLGFKSEKIPDYSQSFGEMQKLSEVLSLKPPDFAQQTVQINNKHLQVFFAPFGSEKGEGGIMVIIHDITEQQQLDNVRREFVSNVSHELRTPLTNIKSYAETLSESDSLPEETVKQFSFVIVNEADRMTRLVRDLLTLSRFDYGKMDWSVNCHSISKLIQNVYDVMLLEAERHSHTTSLEFKTLLPDVWMDNERIEQVIINIYANAITYTPDGGRIDITASHDGENVSICIKDNGIGIPEEDIPRLFERFYRVDKARSRSLGGTGLGLAIAQEIVQNHNGHIEITSSSGEGTAMTVVLPIEKNRM